MLWPSTQLAVSFLRVSAKRKASDWVRTQTMQRSIIALRESAALLQVLVGDTNFKRLDSLHSALGLEREAYVVVTPAERKSDDYIIVLQPGWVVRQLVIQMGISYKALPPINKQTGQP